jgi:lambda family phage portal protein
MTTRKKPAAKTAIAAKTPAKRGRPTNAERAARQAAQAQTSIAVVNRYDAGGVGRRMRGWMPPSSGPNKAIVGIQKIRDRSRDSVRNDWSSASGVQHWTTNLIGTGIVPRITEVKSKERKKTITQTLDRWFKQCDADNVLDFYGMQTLATRAWIESGEVFARLRYRRSDSGMEIPLQVQLIESEYVPMLDADYWPGLPSGHRIRSGIELTRSGQRVAYWVYKEHPGDGQAAINASDLVRVPKWQMIHVFEPKRPGQLRGVPENAPILAKLRDIADYDGNVLERMKIGNLFAGFITRPSAVGLDDKVDPLTGMPIKTDSSDTPMVAMEPATMQELLPGEGVTFANPPEPGTMYHEYMRTQNLQTAAGMGLPYELLSGDIKEISDRTLRVTINEFRRYAEQRQWQIIIPQFCRPVFEAAVLQAAIVGLIGVAEIEAVTNPTWAPQAWPYIHPVQDVQAKQAEVDGMFRSRSSVISERGDDPDLVDQEIADDQKREKELGIEKLPPEGQQPGKKKPGDEDNIAPGEYPRNRALDNLTNTVARLETVVSSQPKPDAAITALADLMRAQQANNEAMMKAFTDIAQALVARPLTVENVVETPAVNVAAPNVTVEPPAVNVTNEVKTPTVNVAAPNVTVESPAVNVTNEVQPAEVKVELPDRKITSDITRDQDGQIKKVVQTETTVK